MTRSGCSLIDRQPLGHAPRHLAVQPGRRVGALQALQHARQRHRVERSAGAALGGGHAGSILSRCRASTVAGLSSQCEVCRQWADGRAVRRLRRRALRAAVPRCGRCGLRLGLPAPACGACLRDAAALRAHRVRRRLRLPLGRADRRRSSSTAASNWRRRWPSACWPRCVLAAAPPPQLVVPVPLAPARLAERGYNQAWELARRLAPALGVPARAQSAVASGGQRAPGRTRPRRAPAQPAQRLHGRPAPPRRTAGPPRRAGRRRDDHRRHRARGRRGAAARRRGGGGRVGAWRARPDGADAHACSTSSSSRPRSRPTPAT